MKIIIALSLILSPLSFAQTFDMEAQPRVARVSYKPGDTTYEVAFNEVDRYQLRLPTVGEVDAIQKKPIVGPLIRFFKYYLGFKGAATLTDFFGLTSSSQAIRIIGGFVIFYVGTDVALDLIGDCFRLTGQGLTALYNYTFSRPSFHRRQPKPQPTEQQNSGTMAQAVPTH